MFSGEDNVAAISEVQFQMIVSHPITNVYDVIFHTAISSAYVMILLYNTELVTLSI